MFIVELKVAVAITLAVCVTGLGAGAGIHAVAKGPPEIQVADAQARGAPVQAPADETPAAKPDVWGDFPPIAERVQVAPIVVVGKVDKFEKWDRRGPQIIVIKIEESFKGMKGVASVRVGRFKEGNGQDLRLPFTDGVFFLKKYREGDFYILHVNDYHSYFPKTRPGYEEQVKLIRDVVKFMETPLEKSLKADKAEDRLLAAGMLIMQYRRLRVFASAKEEEIDAEQSRLILKALKEADFKEVEPRLGISKMALFYHLGVTEKDGWQQPESKYRTPNLSVYHELIEAWLKKNQETYRIKRFVETSK